MYGTGTSYNNSDLHFRDTKFYIEHVISLLTKLPVCDVAYLSDVIQ